MENNQQMSDLNPTIFIKTLNINGKKKNKMKICQPGLKKNSTVCCLQVTHFKSKEID